MEQHHLITEEVLQMINSYKCCDKLMVSYAVFTTFFWPTLSPQDSFAVFTEASSKSLLLCLVANRPHSLAASLPPSLPSTGRVPASPSLSGYIWPSILLGLLISRRNHKPIDVSWIVAVYCCYSFQSTWHAFLSTTLLWGRYYPHVAVKLMVSFTKRLLRLISIS